MWVYIEDGAHGGQVVDVPAQGDGQPPSRIELQDEPVPRGKIENGPTGFMPSTTSVYLLDSNNGGPDGQPNYRLERPS